MTAVPGTGVRVEVLYFDGCPSHEALLPRLRALLDRHAAGAELALRPVAAGDAQRERFLGSPTVRVDGEDVEPAATGRSDYGFKCRLYPTPDGLVGAPPDAWVIAALEQARG